MIMNKLLMCSIVVLSFVIAEWSRVFPCADQVQPPDTQRLTSQVLIRRDTFGVPHILAETEEAALFGMGYAQAEDHCVEIARRLISARGEEAKYTGLGAENDLRQTHCRHSGE